MAQRVIEMLIGRLVTDRSFRAAFVRSPEEMLRQLREQGLELSRTETTALLHTDRHLWARVAQAIDSRLHNIAAAID